ncbi:hypothetical protein CEB3_c14240 [Peptococcaceae bacterium CEB3]|nr:hypothetical protein CEB3_c14240 [Peptococcaceae bacterium CEB3]
MRQRLRNAFPWKTLEYFLGVTFGAVVVGISMNTFIIPNRIADGGVTGIAIILHYLYHWPVGWVVFILNVPLFVLGLKLVGRKFLILSFWGVALLSLTLQVTTHMPVLTKDTLLSAIFGGVLTGVGMGVIFRSRGSLGGTDILAVFLSRTTPLSVGQILLGMDALIFTATAILFRPEAAMYAAIYMFIATRVIDLVQEGMSHSKAVMVVTEEPGAVAQEIMAKLGRGVTLFQAEGAYSGEAKKVVYCVVGRTELTQVKEIVRRLDPKAFLTVSEVPEVVGEGFASWKGH